MTKFKGHIPTETYGFIEFELEGEAQDDVLAYKDLQAAYKDGSGLPQKEFNACLDTYIRTGKFEGGVECWENMNDFQRKVIGEVRKSLKRK